MGVERTAQARGKLLLFGEHAAVYGHPAVGLALPWLVTATHYPGHGWEFPSLGLHEAPVRAVIDRLCTLATEQGLKTPTPGRLVFKTEIPVGAGFGSSGALCGCLVNLFFPELPIDDRDRVAWQAEGQFHGTPSGIDTALALRAGWWALDAATHPVKASPLADPKLVLVVGALVRVSDTKTLIGSLAKRRADGDRLVFDTLHTLGKVSTEAVTALSDGRAEAVPGLTLRAREGLRLLGLESPVMTEVLDRALSETGAVAGKLSGAGGGGAFFLIYPNHEVAIAALSFLGGFADASDWVLKPRLV